MRTQLPEIEWDGWISVGRRLRESADDTLWFAARSLVPATVMWLGDYRQSHPALFEFKA
jgi:hypothetical protein